MLQKVGETCRRLGHQASGAAVVRCICAFRVGICCTYGPDITTLNDRLAWLLPQDMATVYAKSSHHPDLNMLILEPFGACQDTGIAMANAD